MHWYGFLITLVNPSVMFSIVRSSLQSLFNQDFLLLIDKTSNGIRNKIGKNYIWVSINKTTDSCGGKVANFIIRELNEY